MMVGFYCVDVKIKRTNTCLVFLRRLALWRPSGNASSLLLKLLLTVRASFPPLRATCTILLLKYKENSGRLGGSVG